MAYRLLCRACNAPVLRVSALQPVPVLRVSVLKQIPRKQIFRNFADKDPKNASRTKSSFLRSIKLFLLDPSSKLPFNIGRGVMVSGAIVGIGALAFYGSGAIDKSAFWPQYVKDRIKLTYICFFTAITITAISAVLTYRSQRIMNYVANNYMTSLIISLVGIIGTGLATQSVDYKTNFRLKLLVWMIHAAVTGCVLAPMAHYGGSIWIEATWYTWWLVGGLTTIAITAPNEKFLMTRGPLAMGVSMVLSSTLEGWAIPHGIVPGDRLFSIILYGGLIAFSGFLLHDTQMIVLRAETYPARPKSGTPVYDPINVGMEMYMNIFNIFFRMTEMLDFDDLIDYFTDLFDNFKKK